MNTEIIAFFSAGGVFSKRTAETQRKAFDALAEAFKADFDRDMAESDWQTCLDYIASKAKAKQEREAAKIAREAEKAAKLAAMPVSGGVDCATAHIETRPAGLYVLTSAQNNTDVDPYFLASLKRYCEQHDATLLIAVTPYNQNAYRKLEDEEQNIWFDPAIRDYLVDTQVDLGGMHFVGNANVIPTSKWPTSGFESASPAGVDVIVPASVIELRVGAALKGASTKRIAGTGSVTKRNYIPRKAGSIAGYRHCFAAVVVDTRDGTLRHLQQVEGAQGFYDLDGFYSPHGFKPLVSGDLAAIQPGDIHAEKMEGENLDNLIDMIETYNPDHVILHDVLDFSSRNHHNVKDPLFLHSQFVKGNTVLGDLEAVSSVLDTIAGAARRVHIVESNHDLAVETWIKTADWKADPINAQVYLDIANAAVTAQADGVSLNMLEYAYNEIGGGNYDHKIDFHTTDESLMIAGVEMGNHGHNGANGARGNPKGFASLGVAINTGHTHSPSIYWPCFTAGVTASLEMGYNMGASSWAVAHTFTYENGQRQIVFA
jgi:hypothetical protein